MNIKRIVISIVLLVLLSNIVLAQNTVHLYFFYGETCPHCAQEELFLDELEDKYPDLKVHHHEVYYDSQNQKLFKEMAQAFGTSARGVPTTFVNDKVWVGYAPARASEIEERVKTCIEQGCIDPLEKIGKTSSNGEISTDMETVVSVEHSGNGNEQEDKTKESTDTNVELPFIGQVDASKMSLPALTLILGFIDGFNPCAFFVLLFLLSMLIYAKSRKRMLIIGGTFVLFSGLIYFIFMAAWLNIFLLIGSLKMVTTIAGTVAVIIAVINIKDFFLFNKGISLSISDEAKPKLFQRMRNLLRADSMTNMLIGTIVLAVAANMYELLCTAGFPMVFTRILTLNNFSSFTYYMYLVFYNIVYVVPLAVVVGVFTKTLGAKKMTEWQGRVLKLLSGMMMLSLGLLLLFVPELLNNVFISVGVIAFALFMTWIIVTATKDALKEHAQEDECVKMCKENKKTDNDKKDKDLNKDEEEKDKFSKKD